MRTHCMTDSIIIKKLTGKEEGPSKPIDDSEGRDIKSKGENIKKYKTSLPIFIKSNHNNTESKAGLSASLSAIKNEEGLSAFSSAIKSKEGLSAASSATKSEEVLSTSSSTINVSSPVSSLKVKVGSFSVGSPPSSTWDFRLHNRRTPSTPPSTPVEEGNQNYSNSPSAPRR